MFSLSLSLSLCSTALTSWHGMLTAIRHWHTHGRLTVRSVWTSSCSTAVLTSVTRSWPPQICHAGTITAITAAAAWTVQLYEKYTHIHMNMYSGQHSSSLPTYTFICTAPPLHQNHETIPDSRERPRHWWWWRWRSTSRATVFAWLYNPTGWKSHGKGLANHVSSIFFCFW